MSLIHLDLTDNVEIQLLQQHYEFKGLKLNKNNCKLSFKHIETGEAEEVLVDYEEALFNANIIAHLDITSLILLNFEDFIEDSTLMTVMCKFDYLDADIELNGIEKQMQERNNNRDATITERTESILQNLQLSDTRSMKKALSLLTRLRVMSIRSSEGKLSIKASRYKNESTIDNETFFFPSEKGTEVNYLPIGIGSEWVNEEGELCVAHSQVGKFTPFFLELHEQFKSIEQHAFLFFAKKMKRLSPILNSLSLSDSIEEINQTVGGSASDAQPAGLF